MIPIPSLKPYLVYAKGAAVLILILLLCAQVEKCTASKYETQIAILQKEAAQKHAESVQKARKQEQDWSAAFDVAATLHQENLNDATSRRDRIIAGLRSGRLSFPACPVPEAAADSAATESRAEGGQPGLVGEAITERFAVCDQVTHERNMAVRLLEAERSEKNTVQ